MLRAFWQQTLVPATAISTKRWWRKTAQNDTVEVQWQTQRYPVEHAWDRSSSSPTPTGTSRMLLAAAPVATMIASKPPSCCSACRDVTGRTCSSTLLPALCCVACCSAAVQRADRYRCGCSTSASRSRTATLSGTPTAQAGVWPSHSVRHREGWEPLHSTGEACRKVFCKEGGAHHGRGGRVLQAVHAAAAVAIPVQRPHALPSRLALALARQPVTGFGHFLDPRLHLLWLVGSLLAPRTAWHCPQRARCHADTPRRQARRQLQQTGVDTGDALAQQWRPCVVQQQTPRLLAR